MAIAGFFVPAAQGIFVITFTGSTVLAVAGLAILAKAKALAIAAAAAAAAGSSKARSTRQVSNMSRRVVGFHPEPLQTCLLPCLSNLDFFWAFGLGSHRDLTGREFNRLGTISKDRIRFNL